MNGQRRNFRYQRRGFTLVEMLVVLVIVSLVVVAGRPLIAPPTERTELRTAARELSAVLRHGRARAVSTGRDVTVVFEPGERRYRVDGIPGPRALPASATIELIAAESELAAGSRAAAIRFYPDGSASGGRLQLSGGQQAYTVAVDWLTGRVRVESP